MSINPTSHNTAPVISSPRRWLAVATLLITLAACSSSKPPNNVLEDAKKHGGVHFLPDGQDCPAGGDPFVVPELPDAYMLAVDQADPSQPDSPVYAVLVEQGYRRTIGKVVCGPDGGPKYGNVGTRFEGKAVLGISDTTQLVAVALLPGVGKN